MIIGHLPAGYVVSKLSFPRFGLEGSASRPFLWAGMLGAVAPDLDMVYFHLVDHGQHHHHTYWPHWPIVWLGLLLVSGTCFYTSRSRLLAALATLFSLNGLVHMLLDSIVGDVWWLAPFVDEPFSLFRVPALYHPWWLNFVLHESFALELAVVVWAAWLWRRGSDPSSRGRAARAAQPRRFRSP